MSDALRSEEDTSPLAQHEQHILLSAGLDLIEPCGDLLPAYILNPHASHPASLAPEEAFKAENSW